VDAKVSNTKDILSPPSVFLGDKSDVLQPENIRLKTYF